MEIQPIDDQGGIIYDYSDDYITPRRVQIQKKFHFSSSLGMGEDVKRSDPRKDKAS